MPALATTLEVVGRRARLLVHTDVPLYQRRIVHMGWRPLGRDTFVRQLDAAPDVESIHARFAEHLEEMVLQSARLRPVLWDQALEMILDRIDGSAIDWWLYGSVALALRGLDVEPGDIDIAVSDAIRTGQLFGDVLVEPVTHLEDWAADAIGRAFHSALFEWLSGPHDFPVPHEHASVMGLEVEEVRWRDWTVPVPPLTLQLAVAEARGQNDRAAAIRRLVGR